MMRRKLLSCLLALALALSLTPALSGTAEAVSSLPNFKVSADGKISWDHPAPGLTYYIHGLLGLTLVAIRDDAYTFNGCLTRTDTSVVFDLQKYMDDDGDLEEKTYELTVKDVMGHSDPGNYSSSFTFDYHSRIPKLATPQNLRWDGTTISWDPVPNAGCYWVGVYQKPDEQHIWNDRPGSGTTSEDLTTYSSRSNDPPVAFRSDGEYYFLVRAYPEVTGTYRISDTARSETLSGSLVLRGYKTGDPFNVYVDGGYARPSAAAPGETVTLTYTGLNSSHGSLVDLETAEFDHWEVTRGGVELADPNSSTTTFVMPQGAGDVSIKAVSRSRLCSVTFDPNGGTGTMSAVTHLRGTAYTFPQCGFTPPEGLVFAGWQPDSSGGSYKPGEALTLDQDVTLKAVWTEPSAKTNPFVDVFESDQWYDAVLWAYYATPQVTNGVDATHFGPTQTVTRGQCAAFLWRAMGEPEPASTYNPFVDVPSWQYYYKPILWAVEKGITKGTDATHFSPDQTLSTAHIITFLYRAKNPGADGWYGEAEYWAERDYGLYKPFGISIAVDPDTSCPRGYVVMFLQMAK